MGWPASLPAGRNHFQNHDSTTVLAIYDNHQAGCLSDLQAALLLQYHSRFLVKHSLCADPQHSRHSRGVARRNVAQALTMLFIQLGSGSIFEQGADVYSSCVCAVGNGG